MDGAVRADYRSKEGSLISQYAKTTRVPVKRSKQEIEKILTRYGVDDFFYGSSAKRGGGIGFTHKGRIIKIGVPLPDKNDYSTEQKWGQEYRRRWRVLLLALKAKLELVDAGLVSFEDEFLAQTCLPDGRTVSQYYQPLIDEAVKEGKMPKALLPGI